MNPIDFEGGARSYTTTDDKERFRENPKRSVRCGPYTVETDEPLNTSQTEFLAAFGRFAVAIAPFWGYVRSQERFRGYVGLDLVRVVMDIALLSGVLLDPLLSLAFVAWDRLCYEEKEAVCRVFR